MNNTNQLAKGNVQINSILRATGSGRLKMPSRDLGSLNTSSKKPFLKQYSIAMEQKLQNLKEKINEKKKQKTKEQLLIPNKRALDQKLQKFLKTKSKPEQKNLQQTIQVQINKQKLSNFLAQNNLLSYQSLLAENQIDSLEILADATQKQLEEIGIPKGHALKLKVNISKWSQSQAPEEKQKSLRETKTKDSERNNSFVSVSKSGSPKIDQKQKEQMEKKVESICIGTQEDGMQSITFVSVSKPITMPRARSKFCMFCYQSIMITNLVDNDDFCSEDCSDRYNQMFKKYENNLIKAEQEFNYKKDKSALSNKKEENNEQPQSNQDDNQDRFDFLENEDNYQGFNYEDYERLRKALEKD